ncbi:MAG: peroxidase [Proteobacteria bacterium]|nr:peroxidase [Pseudomonadota bacterium]
MTKQLDLLDIQGNILRAYGRFGYPVARYVFLNVRNAAKGRDFVRDITKKVTTSVEWGKNPDQIKRPDWTVNIAFTYQGLKDLGVPMSSLVGFSAEFASGMKERKDILGDDGPSSPENWDPIWRGNRETREQDVHIFISLNALAGQGLDWLTVAEKNRDDAYAWLLDEIKKTEGGVVLLGGHRGDDGAIMDYQDGKIVMEGGMPSAKEHFGYTDGISDPVFEGVPYDAKLVKGRGKQMGDGTWAPLATGEFLLGHVDEAKEYPPAPNPVLLSRNGTYMVYRKLHENVATYDSYLEEHGKKFPGGKELLAAKFVGRWRDNGAPLTRAPDAESKAKFDQQYAAADDRGKDALLSDFTYDDDMSGAKCPFSSHIRRINPRASLEMMNEEGDKPGSFKVSKDAFDTPGALANRRRLLRRGLPYGEVKDRTRDDGNHGIVIMMVNADINRQFEFVQQQWVNYGNDFKAGNDKEIILGNHSLDGRFPSKAVIEADPDSDQPPYILSKIPRLVETRGGDYFFIPSMTALRMIARGVIDPT